MESQTGVLYIRCAVNVGGLHFATILVRLLFCYECWGIGGGISAVWFWHVVCSVWTPNPHACFFWSRRMWCCETSLIWALPCQLVPSPSTRWPRCNGWVDTGQCWPLLSGIGPPTDGDTPLLGVVASGSGSWCLSASVSHTMGFVVQIWFREGLFVAVSECTCVCMF